MFNLFAAKAQMASACYTPTLTDNAYRRVLRQAICAIFKQGGFDVTEAHLLELLTHMLNTYMNELCITAQGFAELSGRNTPMPTDAIMALADLGCQVMQLPAFLKECTSRGSLVVASPKDLSVNQPASQLRVGFNHPRPSYIPEWLPPFPDPHTYVHTEVSGEPELSFEKIREERAKLERNTIVSMKNFFLHKWPSISLFDAHKQKVLKKADELFDEQRQLKLVTDNLSSVEENGVANAIDGSEHDNVEFYEEIADPQELVFQKWEDDSAKIAYIRQEVPTFGEVLLPKTNVRSYVDALVPDDMSCETGMQDDDNQEEIAFFSNSPSLSYDLDDDSSDDDVKLVF